VNRKEWGRWSILYFSLTGLASSPSVVAESFLDGFTLPKSNWSVSGAATRTSNATRAPDGPSDTIVAVGVAGGFYKDEGRLQANIHGSAQYLDYLDNTFDADTVASLSATIRYAVVPDRFSWHMEDTFGQAAANTFQASTPDNRTDANFFSTGPDFVVRLGSMGGLRIAGRYARTDFNRGDIDDTRLYSEVGAFRRLSQASTVSLNVSAERVEYRALQDSGYDTQEYFGRIETRRGRYSLALDAGASQLHDLGRSRTMPLVRLIFYRRLTRSWNLNLSAVSEYRNSGDIIRSTFGQPRIVNGEVAFSDSQIDPYDTNGLAANATLLDRPARSESATAALDFKRARTTLGLSASTGRERYQFGGESLDRKEWRINVNASRRLRASLRAVAALDYAERKFDTINQRDDDRSASVALSWNVSGQLDVSLGYRYEERESDFAQFRYEANLVYLGVSYGSGRVP
jgi:hypothetical protein